MRATVAGQPLAAAADVLVLGAFSDVTPALEPAAALVGRGEARPTPSALAVTHLGERPLVVAGLGPREDFDAERGRRVAAVVARRARELGGRSLAWAMPQDTIAPAGEVAEALVVGTGLAAYRFARYRPAEPDDPPAELDALTLHAGAGESDVAGLAARVARVAVLVDAQNRARDLGNTPPNDMTPTGLAEHAQGLADRHDSLRCEVLDEAQIRERGMGAFAAVAAGSAQPAKLIALRHDGPGATGDGPPRLALIGKAVTFDSGGLNLKPGPSMIGMKFDMAGGAAVIEALGALAELGAPGTVLGLIGATENMTGGAAMKPGDILRAYDGTTIEMNNADAEGRLVLADCITHARRAGAEAIVDVATLTGAVVTALGSTYAGLMASDDALAARLVACGERTGELLWRLPLHPDYAERVKGRYAQITNLPEPPRHASSITAAEFLHHFAGDVAWAHLDIAGVADDVKLPYFDKGGTGFGVRLLAELALGD